MHCNESTIRNLNGTSTIITPTFPSPSTLNTRQRKKGEKREREKIRRVKRRTISSARHRSIDGSTRPTDNQSRVRGIGEGDTIGLSPSPRPLPAIPIATTRAYPRRMLALQQLVQVSVSRYCSKSPETALDRVNARLPPTSALCAQQTMGTRDAQPNQGQKGGLNDDDFVVALEWIERIRLLG